MTERKSNEPICTFCGKPLRDDCPNCTLMTVSDLERAFVDSVGLKPLTTTTRTTSA